MYPRGFISRGLAIAGLAVTSPLLIGIASCMYILDGAPIVFKQERLGLHRVPFIIWKLRTMRGGQVTALGKFLRVTGVDELPQLLNIAKGEMRFIGPRPITIADAARLGWIGERHAQRWSVQPGLTGWAQLSSICSAEESWRRDQAYILNQSVAFDLKIISLSVLIPLLGKDRVRRWSGESD